MTTASHNPTNQRKSKMKYLLTAAVLAFAAPAHAETATVEPETQDVCQIIGILAGGVMEFRQDGIELSLVMSRLEENPDFSAEFKSVVRELAIEAYQTPIHFNPEAGVTEAASFRNQYELACYIEGADK